MAKKHVLLFVTIIAVLGIVFACTQSPGGGAYTVTYDGNGNTGGTVPIDSNIYEQGETITALDNTGSLVKMQDGISFFFTGWNTTADGSGTDYAASATFAVGNANLTLYAQWSALGAAGPAGGLIFYDAGSVQSWGRYLEAAPSDQSTSQVWIEGGETKNTENGNTSSEIGTGQANSDYIVAQTGHTGSAAQVCLDYDDGTYSDWFLPSLLELEAMYDNLKSRGLGGFADDSYWSSSECNENMARVVSFDINNDYVADKDFNFRVRAVRAF